MRKNKKKNDVSRLARLILLMRNLKKRLKALRPIQRLKERQKALSYCSDGENFEESKISYVFGMAKIISALLLALLLVVTVIFGSGVISYDKMYYMFKDIAYIKSYGEGIPDELSYSSPVQNQVHTDFKNGLFVASDSELKMFTSTGRVTLNEGSEFTNPRVTCSNSSALVFDQGRRTYSIYNSFVKLYTEKTEYPIALADMAENGSYLIVTKSKLYNSVVKIYDQNYNQTGEYSKNDTVISASMSDNGRHAAILSVSVHGGKSSAELDILDCKKSEIVAQGVFDNVMPYMCKFLSDDRIAVFSDGKFSVVNKKADTVYEYTYPSEVENIDISDWGFAILFSPTDVTGEKILETYDNNGKRTFIKNIKDNVRDIKLGEGYIYILKSNEILRINAAIGTESKVKSSADNMEIVVFDGGGVAVCSQNAAAYISFD